MTREEKMTPEEAIAEISFLKVAVNKVVEQALDMAIQALSQVSEIEENIIKYMKKYPNHVGNIDFWEGFYACRNVVLQLDDEEYSPKEQEPCDEKRDCSTCKYEEYSSNYQPCRDCGTLLESYTNWEQKERELPCIYDLKNRYCPRLNESGFLTYPQQEVKQEPCDDAVSREAVLEAVSEGCQEWRGIYGRCEELINALPSVTQKSGKWIHFAQSDDCSLCGYSTGKYGSPSKYCPECGAKMESEDKE